ncbi:SDR family NAD(P)-dependent oxidoreductase [Cryptosporangium sp. NPDC051539]|uniref:SDR family NAD(P)-dependent oxidoreductase n=1 Tax=Cryptosporangium sp. NPDC051539 TaxID=3363962 RepID=UPI0037B8B173
MNFHGNTALVTGASSGLGVAFAEALAARGANVVLVARSTGPMTALAERLRATHGIRADVITQDLSVPGAAEAVRAETDRLGLRIDLLVNNAGFASAGRFDQMDPERAQREIALDVSTVVGLTHAYLPGMAERRHGGVLNVASISAFQPTPYMSVYGAAKSFVLSFGNALWEEYRGLGVRVTTLAPGPVATKFFDVVGTDAAQVGTKLPPEKVVEVALRGLEKNRPVVVPGLQNALLPFVNRFSPRRLVLAIAARSLRAAAVAA